jgi:hypothetical protein
MFGSGQKPDLMASQFDFRFAFENGLKSDVAPCPKSAAGSTGRRNTGVKISLLEFQIARSQVVVR